MTQTHRIAIVGEAWGREEALYQAPFVGASGRLLTEMLEEAGIDRGECFLTNVFNLQPRPTNDIKNLCVPKRESSVRMPQLAASSYLADEYWPEVERLYGELEQVRPNIVLALGNTASWALLHASGISALRGTVSPSITPPGLKVLPTFHPAAVLRDTKLQPIVQADLFKAEVQSHFPEIRRPKREIWIEPDLPHLELFFDEYLRRASHISLDIETAGDQITCIGFAPNPRRALVVPFVDLRKPSGSYWPSAGTERRAWEFVRKVLQLPCPKVLQNCLYDIHWLWKKIGLALGGPVEDTMLMHHAMQPESPKGLGFLGSMYTDEPAWKTMAGKGLFTMKKDN